LTPSSLRGEEGREKITNTYIVRGTTPISSEEEERANLHDRSVEKSPRRVFRKMESGTTSEREKEGDRVREAVARLPPRTGRRKSRRPAGAGKRKERDFSTFPGRLLGRGMGSSTFAIWRKRGFRCSQDAVSQRKEEGSARAASVGRGARLLCGKEKGRLGTAGKQRKRGG